MFKESSSSAPVIDSAFRQSSEELVKENPIYNARKAVIAHYEKAGGGHDEFDMAASLIAGKVMNRAEADAYAEKMTPAQSDAFFEITSTIDKNSPRRTIEAIMIETGLLPDDKGKMRTPDPLENSGPKFNM